MTTTTRSTEESNNLNNNNNANDSITVGRLVEVASRTWPGINKPGGVARVTEVKHSGDKLVSVSVHYILGSSKERNVPVEYVTLAPQYEVSRAAPTRKKSLRDRNMLLGRCHRCGSLRTDCGSCDWAMEEQQALVSAATTTSTSGRSSTVKKKKKTQGSARQHSAPSWSDSSSASSSDDDEEEEEDVVLQQLVKESQSHYRKHLKKRRQWNALGMTPTCTFTSKTHSTETTATNNTLEDSSSSEEDIADILEQNERRYQQYLRTKNRRRARQLLKVPKVSPTHRSVLETATTKPTTKKRKQSHDKNGAEPTLEDSGETFLDKDDASSLPRTPQRQSPATVQNVSPVGVVESSSPESVGLVGDDHDDDPYPMTLDYADDDDDSSLDPMSDYDYDFNNTASNHHDDDDMVNHNHNNSDMLALSQFIQPEGRAAADNLPQDTVDLTKSLAYHQLPEFFDGMAAKIENELLPDFKLQTAELQRQLRILQNPGRLTSDNNDSGPDQSSYLALLRNCQECWTQIRQDLIRNGTDQCGAAVRQMNNDRLYAKHKKNLSTLQRKQFRGNMLDVRSMRMDSLEEATEALVRKLRSILNVCEEELIMEETQQQQDGEHAKEDSSSEDEAEDDDPQESTQDLFHLQTDPSGENVDNNHNSLDPCERPLAPFDPHMHASRKRRKKLEAMTVTKQRSVVSSSSRSTMKRHKKKRLSNSLSKLDLKARRNCGSIGGRAKSKSKVRRSQQHPRNRRQPTKPREALGLEKQQQIPDNDNVMLAEFETDENDPMENQAPSNALDGPATVPTFGLFDDSETNQRTISGSKRRRRQGRSASAVPLEPVVVDCFSNNRRDRQPIADRMQAFLDANNNATASGLTNKATSNSRQQSHAPPKTQTHRNRPTGQPYEATPTGNANSSQLQRRPRRQSNTERPDSGDNPNMEGSLSDPSQETERSAEDVVNVDDLFHQLVNPLAQQRVSLQPVDTVPGSWNANDISLQLRLSLASNSSSSRGGAGAGLAVYDRLRSALENGTVSRAAVLPKIFDVLCVHGKCTLQEMCSLNSPALKSHVRLLAQFVLLLKTQPSGQVFSETQGLLLETIVSKPRPCYDWLVLQLVEVVYSLMLPDAWALKQNIPRGHMLQILTPLRDALAKAVPLMECVCATILSGLGCQKWRRGVTPGHAYVSSIDPAAWQAFWDKGNSPEKPQVVRLEKLGKVLPRVEAEALWGVLAYFGASPSSPAETSLFRWQLVSRIFSSGVLAGETHDVSSNKWLPPSGDQIGSCVKEVRYFTDLISQRSLDTLPSSDSVVLNLIRRSLELQSDEYYGNETARANCYPLLANPSATKKAISRLWKATHLLFFKDADFVKYIPCASVGMPSDAKWERDHPRLKHALVPTSPILQQVLALLSAWYRRIPSKKARQNRWIKSIQVLQQKLVDQATEAEELSSQARSEEEKDAFSAAFHAKPSSIAGTAAQRRAIFLREAAAYLTIAGIMSRNFSNSVNPMLSHEATTQLWDMVADSPMKRRQQEILDGKEPSSKFEGDPVRLLSAAKVMACSAFALMNRSPWNLNVGKRITRLVSLNPSFATDKKPLKFSISCVFACLECLCDLSTESHVMGHLYSIIALIFTNMSGLVSNGDALPDRQDVIDMCGSRFLPILEKCFKLHLRCSGESHDGLSLRLLYCTIRGVNSFLAVCLSGGHSSVRSSQLTPTIDTMSNQSPGASNGGEDIWGSIDDDCFASIDLPDSIPSQENQTNSSLNSLWSSLTNALRLSKPSERFALPSTQLCEDSMQINMQGKHLISQDVAKICDCLVSVVVACSGDCSQEDLLRQMAAYVRCGENESSDGQFEFQMSQRLTEEVCALSEKFPVCRQFVQTHSEIFVFNYIERILDAGRFESLPSRNLSRIRELNGEEGAAEALTLLEIFNDGFSQESQTDGQISDFEALMRLKSRATSKLNAVWQFGHNLGSSLNAASADGSTSSLSVLGRVLLDDFSGDSTGSLYPVSLESEAIKSLRLLLGVVSAAANQNVPHCVNFEKTSSFIVAAVIKHILRIVQSMKYHDQTCNLNGIATKGDTTRSKISELLTTYTELFIAIVSWILRESQHSGSAIWTTLLNKLYDGLIFAILRRQKSDLIVPLQELQSIAQSLGEGRNRATVPMTRSLSGCAHYINDLFSAAIRRSRQLLVTPFRNRSIQSILLEAVRNSEDIEGDQISRMVGMSFTSNLSPPTNVQTSETPLQQEIDVVFWQMEHSISSDSVDEIRRVRQEFLQIFISPFLCQKQVKIKAKRKILLVLCEIFSAAANEKAMSFSLADTEVLCSCAKSLHFSLVQCLAQSTIDSNFISSLHACSTSFAGVCITGANSGNDDTLINLARTLMAQVGDTSSGQRSREVMSASYLWTFFKWLQTIGRWMIANDASEAKKLEFFRQKCVSNAEDTAPIDHQASFHHLLRDDVDFESCNRLLSHFESLMFPSLAKVDTTIVNKYAKSSESRVNSESMESWTPTAFVKRAAKEFIAEVVAVS